jgi:cytochrome c-type biogenesis protein CcmF
MRALGEICLFVSLVTTGYAAFLSLWNSHNRGCVQSRLAKWSAVVGFVSLTITMSVLGWALVSHNFSFQYVAQYASRFLPWQYCLSALWVGQAGSLLLWAWMTAAVALLVRVLRTCDVTLRESAFGLVMSNVCFLVAVILFAADPMTANPIAGDNGLGLSPLLQHPSMLIHPPIVFLAYSVWSVPCALAIAALWGHRLNATWTQMARPWALSAWTLLGVGLLLGAHWAYQELGWGGYWGWDPVENGSLLPWLTGTALIHSFMAWRHCGLLKKTAFSLAIVTFALCNFATFLTRSGVFSSVHAFSESPIGWMFLALMSVLLVGGAVLIARHRVSLSGTRLPVSWLARETMVIISTFLLLLLTVVVLVGTSVAPISKVLAGRTIQVGPEFYNNVLSPIGLALLGMTAVVPLLRWGSPPGARERRLLAICLAIAMGAMLIAWTVGRWPLVALAVIGLAALAVASLIAAWLQDGQRRATNSNWRSLMEPLRGARRKYASYFIHLGVVCVAVGVAGSSLGTKRHEVTLDEGATFEWAGRQIKYVRLEQHELPDKLMAVAVLEVRRGDTKPVEIRPARHLHLLQNEWTTEVAIQSTWRGDFYTILDAGLGSGRVALTLIDNPMICWIWTGGIVATFGATVALLPVRSNHEATQSVRPPAGSIRSRLTGRARASAA